MAQMYKCIETILFLAAIAHRSAPRQYSHNLVISCQCSLFRTCGSGLDLLIGKIGKCLGPRALGGPAGPCRGPFKAQFSFVNCWKNNKIEKKGQNLKV